MSDGLKTALALPELNEAGGAACEQADRFKAEFHARINAVNEPLRVVAGAAGPAGAGGLLQQRDKLCEAYHKTLAQIDPADPARANAAIERVLAAVAAVEAKAAKAASDAAAQRDAWAAKAPAFDDALDKITQLDEAGHAKAPALVKVSDAIRARANDRSYQEAATALDALAPKLEQVYQEHAAAKTGGDASAADDARPAGGAPAANGAPADLDAAGCRTDDPVQHPLTDRDWATLKTDFVQAIQIWCNSMQHVVNQFERDVGQARADPTEVELAVRVIDGVVSEFLPTQAKAARAVAEPIVKEVIRRLQSGRVSLRAFCETWDARFDAYKSAAAEHDRMFAEFREEVTRECGAGLTLEAVSRRIAYLGEQLPVPDQVRRALLRAWIDSTEDEGCFIDEWEDVAGYFKVTIERQTATRWELREAYLDDTDEQAGVIAMLKKEYPNALLEDLPFPLRVFIHYGVNGEFSRFDKAPGGGWTVAHGYQQVFDAWRASGRAVPTVNDLTEESIL